MNTHDDDWMERMLRLPHVDDDGFGERVDTAIASLPPRRSPLRALILGLSLSASAGVVVVLALFGRMPALMWPLGVLYEPNVPTLTLLILGVLSVWAAWTSGEPQAIRPGLVEAPPTGPLASSRHDPATPAAIPQQLPERDRRR